ncbi:MAG: hypothetical protein Q9187_007144 [Circinaria calcarea]
MQSNAPSSRWECPRPSQAMPAKSFQVAPEMEVAGAASGQDKRSSRNVTNPQTVLRERVGAQKPVDKQSLDYVLRSGLAGGLAGCAVSYKNPLSRITNIGGFAKDS